MRNVFIFLGMLLIVFASTSFGVDVPKTINYQGMITDSAGNPLEGVHNFVFRIWNHPTSGTVKWYENYFGLTVENGLLNVVLGKTTPIDLDFTEDYWMSISVDAETITERIEMTSSLYALRAHSAKLADSATVAISASTGGGWTDEGSIVRLSAGSDNVGIGLNTPNRKLYIAESSAGLSYPLKIDNYHSTFNDDATGILFSVGGEGGHQLATERGKGGLAYQYTNTWNRGKFHFLQNTVENDDNPSLADAVMTITNDGRLGVGTTDPSYKLDVRGDRIQLKEDGTGDWIAMRTDGDVLDLTFSGGNLYFQSLNAGEHILLNPSTNANVGVGPIIPTARLHAVGGDYGIKGKGNTAGSYFEDSAGHGYAYLGYSPRWRGIQATGDSIGGAFSCEGLSGYAYAGIRNRGIEGFGTAGGGYFLDTDGGNYCYVAYGTNKLLGTGVGSFVQNHPEDPGRVVVYSALEGDEVATYTRGTDRLVGGQATVQLGETFKWVTNPDIGLTAHITPRGDCNGMYIATLSTTEMLVKELAGGTSDASFDFIVYGLRIGFEEVSIVQEKNDESYIPSMAGHRVRYNMYPDMRQYNALERFRRMNSEVGRPVLDMSRSQTLRNAVHEFDPTIDRSSTTAQF